MRRDLLKKKRLKNSKNGVRNVKSNSIGLFGNRQSRATAERLERCHYDPEQRRLEKELKARVDRNKKKRCE